MRFAGCLFIAVSAALAAAAPARAQDFTPDQIGLNRIPADLPRLYVVDLALNHMVDGRIHVLDAASLDYLGLIESGFVGMLHVPNAKDRVYVATTFYERLTRGKRTDFLQTFDTATLSVIDEFEVPTKRTMALNYRPLIQGSSDGRLVLIQNATPATSITVVDLQTKSSVEVASPGCYGIYPAATQPLRFSTLCGDGTMGTYTLDAGTRAASRKASEKIFDADEDPLFLHGERDSAGYLILSFKGVVHRISVEEETAKLVETVPLTAGIDGNWRPGGYQPYAFHPPSGVLFVLMHEDGQEGSHKNPSEEIWSYDLKGKRLLSRSPVGPATSLTVSTGAVPMLYGINPIEPSVVRYTVDPAAGYAVQEAASTKVGETATQIEVAN